jgi:glucose/mannose-6-phosphate isomerase
MTTSPLDSDAIYFELDSEGLYGRIAGLPEQLAEAWAAAASLTLPEAYRGCDRTVVLGMGGSGIGGRLLQSLAVHVSARTPVSVVSGYTLPAYAGPRTLVFASSNSGNTEEVLATTREAIDAGAKCIAITTGGKLAALAAESGVPTLAFEWAGEPRSALGWSFASLLAISCGLGLLPDLSADFDRTVSQVRVYAASLGRGLPEASNPAKLLAGRVTGKLPVIIGAEALAPVAYRWRTQMNENAKSWAIADELPEMNHNAPLGFGAPPALVPLLHVILLRHAGMHPRLKLRVEGTLDLLREASVAAEVIDVPGETLVEQMLHALLLGDFASYYAGLLNGVRPSPMGALDWLKSYMASK